MLRRSLLSLALLFLSACPAPHPGPTPGPTGTPTPAHEKGLEVSQVQAPVLPAIDFKSQASTGYVLYQEGAKLSLRTIQGQTFSAPEVVPVSCDANSQTFLTPKMAVTPSALYIAWGRMAKVEDGLRILKKTSSSWTLSKILPKVAFEFFNIESDLQGNVYLASFDTTDEGLKVFTPEGKILHQDRNVSKAFTTAQNEHGAHFFGRFKRVLALSMKDGKLSRLEVNPGYVSDPIGLFSPSQGGYVVAGWSEYYQEGTGETAKYYPKTLSLLLPSGKKDLFSLTQEDAKSALPQACPIEVGPLQGQAYVVQGKLFLELAGKKMSLGPASSLLCRAYSSERTDLLVPGMLTSVEWK